MTEQQIQASVVIATRNRKDDLRQAIISSFDQTVAVEVVVMDDGSTDGSVEMVRDEFPQVRLYQLGDARGPSFQRTRGTELARANIVFPIDDDAKFMSRNTIEQTLAEFDHPRIGAVAIPFIEVAENLAMQHAPDKRGMYITPRYIGCSHALRRDVFLAVGGYREHMFNMGEESDMCIRMLNAGYVTRLGGGDAMHHTRSPVRNMKNITIRIRRNAMLRTWHNVPMPYLTTAMLAQVGISFREGWRRPGLLMTLRGIGAGFAACVRQLGHRKPVSRQAYHLWLKLRIEDAILFEQIEPLLPPLACCSSIEKQLGTKAGDAGE